MIKFWRMVRDWLIADWQDEYESELVDVDYMANWPWWRGWPLSLTAATSIAIVIHCVKDWLGIIK
jgi:hypothetical protein